MSDDAEAISSSDGESAKSISDQVSAKSVSEATAKSTSDGESAKSISDSEGELSDARNGDNKEEGELEDGELETDSDGESKKKVESKKPSERPRIVALPETNAVTRMVGVEKTGICKFYQRGSCTWGDTCKYKHVKVSFSKCIIKLYFQESNWQQRDGRPFNGRTSGYVVEASPVSLLSMNTSLPQQEWEKAIKKRQQSRTSQDDEKSSRSSRSEHRHSTRHRSSSSSASSRRSAEPADAKNIPSLLDLATKMPRKGSII